MSIFTGIEHVSAEGTSNRAYFEEGKYIVEIDSVFLYEKRLGGGNLFIVETTVKESDNPNIKPGGQRNWVQSLTIPTALPRIKAFIGAANGYCPRKQHKELNQNITSDVCNEAVGDGNPLSGTVMSLECIKKTTLSGKDFTQAIWGILNG